MRIDGVAAMIGLERDASLRVKPGARVEICCLSGAVWVTQEGDPRDLFLASGESLALSPRGVTLVTALEPATLRVAERSMAAAPLAAWWRRAAQLKPRAAVVRVWGRAKPG
jgi:hypothetical protein